MTVRLANQELPAEAFNWADPLTGLPIDFSTGWAFTAYICPHNTKTVARTITTGITGAATYPNAIIDWASADLTALTADTAYDIYLYAKRTADGKDRVFNPGNPPTFTLGAAPA